jgi:DNA-binding LytR/AlgR family response regulator
MSAPTALIADDEPQLARALQSQLASLWPALSVLGVARHGHEAAAQIAALQPTLAFLDIQMPGLTGLEVAQGIEGPTRVVFVTAYDGYAVQAFDAAALDYLLKPVTAERLARSVARLQATLNTPADDDGRLAQALRQLMPASNAVQPRLRWIRASVGDLVHQIPIEDVLFFNADEKYTCVHTATGEYLIRTPLVELAAQLDPERFVQVHRSTLVQLDHLAGTRRDDTSRLWLRLRGHDQELPVSRAYVHLFRPM